MTTILLIRHGENEYVAEGRLAGRLPGVHLNDFGKKITGGAKWVVLGRDVGINMG